MSHMPGTMVQQYRNPHTRYQVRNMVRLLVRKEGWHLQYNAKSGSRYIGVGVNALTSKKPNLLTVQFLDYVFLRTAARCSVYFTWYLVCDTGM